MQRRPELKLSVAPMMERTDRHFRHLVRLITRHTRLYTEMLTSGAMLNGDTALLIAFDATEQPLALQLGGSDPGEMARCARIAERAGFAEVNINCGCPSERVRSGRFGACLMAEPQRVARCVERMRRAVTIPVTVKTRIGVDDHDSYEALVHFVRTLAAAGCETFIVHARKAWLAGLSPKENREVPPLRYDVVHRLKQDFPHVDIVLNGGITDLASARAQLSLVDGVMLGREAYRHPYLLSEADKVMFGDGRAPRTRAAVLGAYLRYFDAQLALGVRWSALTRHLAGLYQGLPGARAWRRGLSTAATANEARALIEQAAGGALEPRRACALGINRAVGWDEPCESQQPR